MSASLSVIHRACATLTQKDFPYFNLLDSSSTEEDDSSACADADEYKPKDVFHGFDSPRKVASTRSAANLVCYSNSESEEVDVVNLSQPKSNTPAHVDPNAKTSVTTEPCESKVEPAKGQYRFKKPVSEQELAKMSEKTFAASTERKIQWAVNLFQNWRFSRVRLPECDGRLRWCDIEDGRIQPSNLAHCLCVFLTEVRRVDGTEYPAKTLYSIIVLLQMHFDKMGKLWKLIDGNDFVKVKHTLDNLMKEQACSETSENMSADPISLEAEDKMWQSGILGEQNPNQLRDTVMYLIGISFALRGGDKQRNLRSPGYNPQIVVKKDVNGQKFLEYSEDRKTKTNQGGLKHKWIKPKVVRAYGNTNSDRNLVRLYEKYCSLLPPKEFSRCSALYKYPLKETKVTPRQWYTDKPIGINKVREIVKNLTKEAGIPGRFTNHSLRVTAATRMFA